MREATWEWEDEMKEKYPYLFEDSDVLREEATQNIEVEKIWMHNWGKSLLKNFFLIKSKFLFRIRVFYLCEYFDQ